MEVNHLDNKKAVDYITTHDWRESRLGLDRMEELLHRLGDPHKKLKYIHVAGTNGKGSTCAMLASILTCAGYKTGLYTSPFINRFNERVQVDGISISDADLNKITEQVSEVADQMGDHPTEFELITVIGFCYFCQVGCDIVVLEVGLGGRLDATNIIPTPEVAVIAPISFDHTEQLGNTLEKIAAEKAGIIKSGCSVVSAPQESSVIQVLTKVCSDHNAPLLFADPSQISILENSVDGQRFSYKAYQDLHITLLGAYQTRNAAVVIETVDVLRSRDWNIEDNALRDGIAGTRWPARFEILHREPWVVVDGGHNLQCLDSLVDNINTYFPTVPVTFVVGVMADKDYDEMFRKIIPMAKRIIAVAPDYHRSLPAEDLAAYFRSVGVSEVIACPSVEDGINKGLSVTEKNGLLCAVGSFYMSGNIRAMFDVS